MRLIGHLESENLAERVSRLLFSQGIHNQIEAEEGPRWALWIHAEEDIERARQLLTSFRANPDDPAYRHITARPPEPEPQPKSRPRTPPRPPREHAEPGAPVLTLTLLFICVAVAVLTGLGDHPMVKRLQISEVFFQLGRSWELFLPEVRQGEVWRLFTPAILHFGWAHLLFNCWILWDLGAIIEHRRGARHLLILVLVLGVASNLGQYLQAGPRFGGFSGIIYGLLGYLWMMGRYRPSAGMALHPQTVVLMLVWFVICISGALPFPVANTAHGVGLVAGVIWGRLEALLRR